MVLHVVTWLQLKSHYSLGVGTAAVPALVERAHELRVRALALTDLENLYGQVELHRASQSFGMHAITGIELRQHWAAGKSPGSKRGRVVLLARDRAGYSKLCQIVSARRSSMTSTPPPLHTLECLGDLSGLLVLTDDPETLVGAVRLAAAQNLRALVVRPAGAHPEAKLMAAARQYGVRSVASFDGIFMDETEWELHRLCSAAHVGKLVNDAGIPLEARDRRVHSPEAMQALFDDMPEALVEADRVAESCSLELPMVGPSLGEEPSQRTADRELARICHDRLQGHFAHEDVPAAYRARLTHELETIAALRQAPYFVALGEIVGHANRSMIPILARGSAVASLVVHLLGASPIDPVAERLVFERFLHLRRRELPDVDLDVASSEREALVAWVRGRFGSDRVAQVSALQTYRRRSAYRDGLKALGVQRQQVERFLRKLPSDELLDAGTLSVPREFFPENLRVQLPLVERLVGIPRHQSVHPGGLVIADRPLATLVPLEYAAKGVCITQYGADDIQAAGLVKLDLLGSHALDEVSETFSGLAQRDDVFARDLASAGVDAIGDRDPKSFELIQQGKTLGCFQLETPAVRRVLRRVPIRSLADLTAALAIVRPGPASGQAKGAYVRRARGREPVRYWHPAFESILKSTYGLLLYEEDIALVLSVLAGLDLSTADELRERFQLRQHDIEWLDRVSRRLVQRAAAQGFSQAVASEIWRDVQRFAAYSFNKAHATSYALLAYRTAYLKAHAPVEFGCALLNHHVGSYPKRSIAAELVRCGVSLALPSVRRSEAACSVERVQEGRVIRVGLGHHKHLRVATLTRLLRERELENFEDLADLLRRVRPNARELGALVWSGACDELAPLAADGYPALHAALLARLARLHAARTPGAETSWQELRTELASLPVPETRGDPERVALYRGLSRVQHELDTLEMHVSDHPMRLLRDEAKRQGCVTTAAISEHAGQVLRLAAVIAATRKVAAQGGGVLQFVSFEDEWGLVEATLTPEVLVRHGSWITTPGPFLVEGRVREVEGDFELEVSWLIPFYLRNQPYCAPAASRT